MRLCCLVPLGLVLLVGCGSDSSSPTEPTGPAEPIFDDVTISLDRIAIIRDCDEGTAGDGEFAYKFYVTEVVDGADGRVYLDPDYGSFTAGDDTAWDPGQHVTLRLERREGISFRVRLAMRELDSVADFEMGRHVVHDATMPGMPWGTSEYDLYDADRQVGVITFVIDQRSTCRAEMTYSVTVVRADD